MQFDNLSLNNNIQYVHQSPIVQQPPTPQYNIEQQKFPEPVTNEIPQTAAINNNNRGRHQVARGLQYKDSINEARRHAAQPEPTVSGVSIDAFRLLSVLGRGHFGKVILSQYKTTGMEENETITRIEKRKHLHLVQFINILLFAR